MAAAAMGPVASGAAAPCDRHAEFVDQGASNAMIT
jgi:hypothetical protein